LTQLQIIVLLFINSCFQYLIKNILILKITGKKNILFFIESIYYLKLRKGGSLE